MVNFFKKKVKKSPPRLSESYIVPNPYNLPIHDQAGKNNCTSHVYASTMEYRLSEYFKERTLIDVDDLWEKQKRYGTATDEGDFMDGPHKVAVRYGIRFKTDSGKTGIMLGAKKGWQIIVDKSFPQGEISPYDKEISMARESGYKKFNHDTKDISIDFKNSRLSSVIEESLSQLDELGIELFDKEKIAQGIVTVNAKYKKGSDRGRLGVGGPGQIVGFFIDPSISFVILWIGGHIISDFDNAIWGKLKKALFSIFKSAQPILGKDQLTITTNYKPQIIFVFPSDINADVFLREMDTVTKITKEILLKDPRPNIAYKYSFNGEKNSWELKTREMNAW